MNFVITTNSEQDHLKVMEIVRSNSLTYASNDNVGSNSVEILGSVEILDLFEQKILNGEIKGNIKNHEF